MKRLTLAKKLRQWNNLMLHRIASLLYRFIASVAQLWFRVICQNRLIGMGEQNDDPDFEDLCAVSERWGDRTGSRWHSNLHSHGRRSGAGAWKTCHRLHQQRDQDESADEEEAAYRPIWAPTVTGDGLHHNPAPGMTLSADADKVTGEEIVEAEAMALATVQPRAALQEQAMVGGTGMLTPTSEKQHFSY